MAQLDGSYTTATQGYAAWLRTGVRTFDWLTLGLESAAFGDSSYDAMRAGAFVRWHNNIMDLTVSAGVSGDYDSPSNPYGTLSIYRKF